MRTAKPEAAGMSSTRLARIDDWMDRWIASGRLPGLSVTIHRRGETVYSRVAGRRDVARDLPMTDDTIVRIYSMTKPMTSVAIMMLYEEGLFQLDDPISRVLPAFKNQRVFVSGSPMSYRSVAAERDITYRDLLTHTSGLSYEFLRTHAVDTMYGAAGVDFNFFPGRDPEPGITLAQVVDRAATLPLLAQPGTAWNYSISTDVLGRLVELHSGQPFDQYMIERVIAPLGMTDTGFAVPDASLERFAANYVPDGKGGLKLFDDPQTSRYRNPALPSGGGGLVSTAGDYMRFCRMMLNGGELDGERLLGVKTVEFMTSNQLGGDLAAMGMPRFFESSLAGIGFGLGFSVVLDPAATQTLCSEGNYGWGGFASTGFWCDPSEEMAVVLMTQLTPSSTYPIRRELGVLTYQAIID